MARLRLTDLCRGERVTEVVAGQQVLLLCDPRLFLLHRRGELLVGERFVELVTARVRHRLQIVPVGRELREAGADLVGEEVRLGDELLSRLLDALE